MAPIKDDEAIGRAFVLAMRSRAVTSIISLLLGGAGGNYLGNKGTNERLDQLQRTVEGRLPDNERIAFLEETNANIVPRVEKLEADTVRIPYRRRRT